MKFLRKYIGFYSFSWKYEGSPKGKTDKNEKNKNGKKQQKIEKLGKTEMLEKFEKRNLTRWTDALGWSFSETDVSPARQSSASVFVFQTVPAFLFFPFFFVFSVFFCFFLSFRFSLRISLGFSIKAIKTNTYISLGCSIKAVESIVSP